MATVHNIIKLIQQKAPGFKPHMGLILGSGLGSLAEKIEPIATFSYSELPGLHISTVAGHAGKLILGKLNGIPVACLQGRAHWYEGVKSDAFKTSIRMLRLLGCEALIITNAAGSLRKDVGPGQLMLINDHINLQHANPLVGPNEDEYGPRFFPMDNAYDIKLRERFQHIAKERNIPLPEGVYIGVTGPCFETPAEIRAFRILGADAVGMSTIPEVIVARHCGLRVAVISAITNFASGMSDESITHEGTLQFGEMAAKNLSELVLNFMTSYAHEPC